MSDFYSKNQLLAVCFHLTAKEYHAETKPYGKVHLSLKSAPISSLLATVLLSDGIHSLFIIYGICQSHPRQYSPSVIMIHYQCSEMLVSSVSYSCWHLHNSAQSAQQYIMCWIHPFLHLFLSSFQFCLSIKNLYISHIILQPWLSILCPSTFNRIRPLPTAAFDVHGTMYR